MLVFLNPKARGGDGLTRWEAVRERLRERGEAQPFELITDIEKLQQAVLKYSECGDGHLVAVGGDGTVSLLANAIMQLPQGVRERLVLGAIGIGSSNDFHKPYESSDCVIPKVPIRLGWNHPQAHNIGQVDYLGVDRRWHRRHFIVNSSLGVLAAANRSFNNPRGLVSWLKPRSLNLCIWYAGLKTLMTEPAFEGEIMDSSVAFHGAIMNLSILINPHISGGFTVDIPVSPSASTFGIAICEEMGKAHRLCTMASMSRGRFVGLPGTRTFQTEEIEVQTCRPMALELDGEVFMATRIRAKLLKGAIQVCSSGTH